MIGKPQWFKRRKYGGWGFCPRCWQGWVYVAVLLASFLLIQLLPLRGEWTKTAVMLGWAVVFSVDAVHIMINLPRDERERIHEAVAERNALWAIVLALAAGVAYQVATAVASGNVSGTGAGAGNAIFGAVDPVIIIALFVGLLAKAGTNIYLDSKN